MPSNQSLMEGILKNYTLLILILLIWKLIRFNFLTLYLRNQIHKDWNPLRMLALLLSSLIFFAGLQVYKTRFPDETFQLLLVTCAALGLRDSYEYLKLFSLALVCEFIACLGMAFLSFQIAGPVWEFVFIFYSAGLILPVCALYISNLASKDKIRFNANVSVPAKANPSTETSSKTQRLKAAIDRLPQRIWSIKYGVFLILGPLILTGLAVFKYLPPSFFLMITTLPFIARHNSMLNSEHINSESFLKESSGICMLFIVMICIIRLF